MKYENKIMQDTGKSGKITFRCVHQARMSVGRHMFGYITICKPELKIKDFEKYRGYYCGLCQELKERYGLGGQMTLTYDMTFLILLLTSLYEMETEEERHRCRVHPVKRQRMLRGPVTAYAADMNLLLAWYHLKDDWADERKVSSLAAERLLKKKAGRIAEKYRRQARVFEAALGELSRLEKERSTDIDRTAGCFGRLMEELFVYKKDVWEPTLRRIGFFMGKFIYIMDAYEDLEEDLKKKCYNPLRELYKREDYEQRVGDILCMMMGECSAEFEKLPCLADIDILRNILYDGVWNRYRLVQKKKQEDKKEDE